MQPVRKLNLDNLTYFGHELVLVIAREDGSWTKLMTLNTDVDFMTFHTDTEPTNQPTNSSDHNTSTQM